MSAAEKTNRVELLKPAYLRLFSLENRFSVFYENFKYRIRFHHIRITISIFSLKLIYQPSKKPRANPSIVGNRNFAGDLLLL